MRVYAAIGHIRLDKLTTREIQKFIKNLSSQAYAHVFSANFA
ncbi:MAG: hypothetical protein ACI4SF_00195, partial [Oscillospiraceae bacterium]